jgi:hypothetical protein
VAERFELDEDGARAAGQRAQSASERLLEAHHALVAVLEDREGCWGNDDIGRAFATNYVGLADGTRDNTEVLATNFGAAGEYIVDVAGEFADVDEQNAHEIDAVIADDVKNWTSGS